jgi:hypothetical protein
METITKVALVVGGLFIANKVFSKPKATTTTTTTEEGEEPTSGGGGGGGGGFPMIPNLGLPISPLGLLIKTDAQIKAEAEAKARAESEAKAKAEAEAKAKAVLDSVQQKIKDMQKATSTTVVTKAGGTIGDQLGTSTSTTSSGGFVGGGTNVSSGSTITRAGAPKPIGGVVPFDGTIETLGRRINFR